MDLSPLSDLLASPDLQAVHVISISTASPSACLEAAPQALRQCGGQIRAFNLKPAGERFEAVLRVTGVSDAAAEQIAALIAAWPQAGSAHLEHQVLSTVG